MIRPGSAVSPWATIAHREIVRPGRSVEIEDIADLTRRLHAVSDLTLGMALRDGIIE